LLLLCGHTADEKDVFRKHTINQRY
jgi:hypothetical protein